MLNPARPLRYGRSWIRPLFLFATNPRRRRVLNVRLNAPVHAPLSLRTVGAGRASFTAALLLMWVGFPILYGIGLWISQ
jgi:hypothetical protein